MNKSLLTITALFIATMPCNAHAPGTIRDKLLQHIRPSDHSRYGTAS